MYRRIYPINRSRTIYNEEAEEFFTENLLELGKLNFLGPYNYEVNHSTISKTILVYINEQEDEEVN